MTKSTAIAQDLGRIIGADAVLRGTSEAYLRDATEAHGLRGEADAVCLPATAQEVAAILRWCYAHEVPLVPRGGGTGFAGGAVPIDGGIVLSLERMARVRSFDPFQWRIQVEAGVTTGALRRRVREHGLYFPPDPGASESSHIGGNIATNAGGPHAFKYGVTGRWVTGLEAVVPEGDVITLGGAVRKDVAGYDIRGLLIGSEGTLGIVTAAWLRLIPAPEAFLPVIGFYPSAAEGCAAVGRLLANGLPLAAIEYLDEGTLDASGRTFPGGLPAGGRFLVVAEADGSVAEARRLADETAEVLGEGAAEVRAAPDTVAGRAVWRWRDSVSGAVISRRGWKLSEDIVVPVDRLHDAVARCIEIGRRHDLPACSWGHAGDGNLHCTFMVARDDEEELRRATCASRDLFDMAIEMGGSISGEHGIGWVKRGHLERQWDAPALRLHAAVKHAFDPKGLLNPGKKV